MLNFQLYYIISYNKYQIIIYMVFANQEVRIGKNCAWGLRVVLKASSGTQERGHGFSQYGPTRPDLFPLNLTESYPEESEWFWAVISARFSTTCMNN